MALERQRFLHEDLERLEQAISDRILDDPKNIRDRLNHDHAIAGFLGQIQQQSRQLIDIYEDPTDPRVHEIQSIATGDPFDEFYKRLEKIKEHHRQYPDEPVEDLERTYKRRATGGDGEVVEYEIDNMFTGEEAFGRYFDLTGQHEEYLNLPNVKRLTYSQYLGVFDVFVLPQCPIKRSDKTKDRYFQYLGNLLTYLEGFMKRTRPLEDFDKLFKLFDREFEGSWKQGTVAGWSNDGNVTAGPAAPTTQGTGEGIWCPDCEQEFKSEHVYKHHLSGKKHKRAVEGKQHKDQSNGTGATESKAANSIRRLKERAVAEREYRITRLASAMQTERSATQVNVERRQGMTERERQQEIDALYAEAAEPPGKGADDESDGEGEDRIHNPLNLPLGWDGKPIPFWLYKLHGLGQEFSCEICGNYVYRGRRAFDKHFGEERHVRGLKCLGITSTALFREVTGIQEALNLWQKLQQDKKKEKMSTDNVVQMEDSEGNVMPEKVYYDLQKQGLI